MAGLGFTETAVVYNSYALPVLSFLAQLDDPPSGLATLEGNALSAITPGPYRWRCSEDLWGMKRFGFPVEFRRISIQHMAAKLRVACTDITDYQERASDLDRIELQNLEHGWRWSEWYRISHVRVLRRAMQRASAMGINASREYASLRAAARTKGNHPTQAKHTLQSHLARQLCLCGEYRLMPAEARIRQKIKRWNLGRWLPEAHAARRILQSLEDLRHKVPPCVIAACWGAVWNRWCTGRRFQRSVCKGACCRFGCSISAHDSIEHYALCPVLRNVAVGHLHCDLFLSLPGFLLCGGEKDNILIVRALLVYGTYRAHNVYRAQDVVASPARAADCIMTFIRQAAARHPKSLRALTARWRPQESELAHSRQQERRANQHNQISVAARDGILLQSNGEGDQQGVMGPLRGRFGGVR